MSEGIRVAGRDLVPIATGYEPHAYVFAVGEVTYRISPCADGVGYTLRCVTVDWETDAVFATLEEAAERASQREDRRASPER